MMRENLIRKEYRSTVPKKKVPAGIFIKGRKMDIGRERREPRELLREVGLTGKVKRKVNKVCGTQGRGDEIS